MLRIIMGREVSQEAIRTSREKVIKEVAVENLGKIIKTRTPNLRKAKLRVLTELSANP